MGCRIKSASKVMWNYGFYGLRLKFCPIMWRMWQWLRQWKLANVRFSFKIRVDFQYFPKLYNLGMLKMYFYDGHLHVALIAATNNNISTSKCKITTIEH